MLKVSYSVVYDEKDIVSQMLDTGEYGVGNHDITEDAILEFVLDRFMARDESGYFLAYGLDRSVQNHLTIEGFYNGRELFRKTQEPMEAIVGAPV